MNLYEIDEAVMGCVDMDRRDNRHGAIGQALDGEESEDREYRALD